MSTDICRWLFLLFFLTTWTKYSNSKEIRVVCYYTNWSVYRPGTAKFSPQNINPYLCTHLIYAFGGFTKENTLKPFDKYQDIEKGGYAKFTGLKTYNKNLKTMLAIGGWNEGSSRFSPMVANPERRKELIKNAIKFLRQNHFDGLDLDWEYPSFRDGGKSRDKDNYAQLVQELREEFDRESEKTGRPRLLLTMAVPAGIEYINKGYDVPKLTKYLDWMNILSYDYHSAFEPAVNHHAPLYPLEEPSEYNYDTELNIDYTIQHYLKKGADPSKLVLGIPTYGRSYTLFNPDANEIGAPADGPGDMGEATRENGYLAYYEVCEYIKTQNWEVVQPNPDAMGPYAFKDNQWVGYDDDKIARKKAEYVAEKGLGGIMFWSIDNDDFRGNCHGKPYPIIEAAKEALISAYGLTDENLVSPPTKPIKTKTRNRTQSSSKSTDENSEKKKSTSSIVSRRRNRIKTKSEELSNSQSKSHRKESRRTTEGPVYSSLELVTPSYTTPAPPSTPDLGGGFKCEDEGFYPHPKDCKKYYWCLSGPGELGIVAHLFTCPAGLYFNKAADSCDYTRNVLCNKKLSKATTTTTTTTTTEASTLKTSTARVPPKITAATSRTTVFRTSTTTEAYDDEYEYEDDVEENKNSEEDPKVIKELLDLIKKAGGIEELEKQLKIHEDGSASVSNSDTTTPSSISKSLVERVLGKGAKVGGKKNSYSFLTRNSRGPQNEGLNTHEDKETTQDKGRPKYTTITRQRSTNNKNEDEEEESSDEASKSTKKQPEYVNIRRARVSTTTEEPEENSKSQLNRNKILGEEDETEDEQPSRKKTSGPQYVNIRRQRPSTTEETSTSKYTVIRRGTTTEPAEPEEDETTKSNVVSTSTEKIDLKSRYSILRRGSTTEATTTESGSISSTSSPKRRGTTLPSVPERKRTRGTLAPGTTPSSEDTTTTRYKSIKRGSTSEAPTTDKTLPEDSTLKYSTFTRTPASTQAAPAATEPETAVTVNVQLLTTPESLTVKTTSLSSTKQSEQSNIESIGERVYQTQTPLLLEPRPFSKTSTRSPTPVVTESSTRITKSGRVTTPFLFRVGGRRKTSPALVTVTTTAPKPSSRPTKLTRRKYPTHTSRPLESQEVTTKATKLQDNRYRFVSRKPFFRSTTAKTSTESDETVDQDKESSNQQSLEENFDNNDTTELGDIAAALQEIQQAPIPTKTTLKISTQRTRTHSTNTPILTRTRSRYSTTSPLPITTKKFIVRKIRPQAFEKINQSFSNTVRPLSEYDYYDDEQMSVLGKIPEHSKVLLHSNGVIECLDQGNFPHPLSCKKFISCAKMENGNVLGWEYTCPKNLSFDPIGGICNWSAGLGCNE
ncbi:mucin-5AC isoform X2 [Tribolium castaneum]|nr:PREDICTED: mucin-5AC isoform X3 [Tribolium castaneum]|eukprot:XP_015834046.1 PREDICTED: mucin-5AC isoform X3 [Tribolium castaneum]